MTMPTMKSVKPMNDAATRAELDHEMESGIRSDEDSHHERALH